MKQLRLFAVAALALVAAACNKTDADIVSQIEGDYAVIIEWEEGIEAGLVGEFVAIDEERMVVTIWSDDIPLRGTCSVEGSTITFDALQKSYYDMSLTLYLDPAVYKNNGISTNLVMRVANGKKVSEDYGRIIFRKK